MEEIWKDIEGWSGYQVSNQGRFRSFKRCIEGALLKPHLNKYGYLTIHLRDKNRSKVLQCHRLVMLTFEPISNSETMEVNHKNENKQDNRLSNLEWTTHLENVRHGTGITRKAIAQSQKILCVELDMIFNSVKEASEKMNVNYGNLTSCCNGNLKTVGGYHWKYV